jgi:hypothetical protein
LIHPFTKKHRPSFISYPNSRKENSSPNKRKGRKNIIHRSAPNKLKGRKNIIVHRSAPNKLKGEKKIVHPSAQLKRKKEHFSSISSTQTEERTLFIDRHLTTSRESKTSSIIS